MEGKVKSRANYERLQELQSTLIWPSITELDPKTYVPEVSNVSIATVHNRFFGMRDLPYFEAGIRDFKAKLGRDSGLRGNLEPDDGIGDPP